MFNSRYTPTPHTHEWDLLVEVRDGRVLLAPDTKQVFLHEDGTVTAWRSANDWCHVADHHTAHRVTHEAGRHNVPVRTAGDPPPMNRRGVIRL